MYFLDIVKVLNNYVRIYGEKWNLPPELVYLLLVERVRLLPAEEVGLGHDSRNPVEFVKLP